MMRLMTAVAATALIGLLAMAAPSRADDDDCETVVNALNEAMSIGNKNLETTMDGLKKTMSQSADDKTKAAVKNKFCSASGELLGTSRAIRAVVGECGAKQRAAIASLDKSINEMETAIDGTCK
jgi:hypothetical protein